MGNNLWVGTYSRIWKRYSGRSWKWNTKELSSGKRIGIKLGWDKKDPRKKLKMNLLFKT